MIGVAVYLTVVVAYSALMCGHQGEDWPPGWMWRRWQARRTTRAPDPKQARESP